MKKQLIISTMLVAFASNTYAGCSELMSKHGAPDPATKTMKQLERWVKRKVKDADAAPLTECLVAKAADNPNKAAAAGN